MWYTKTKDGYIYATNGCLNIKMGRESKKYALRIAEYEANRRNLDPNAEGIGFSKEDIFRMASYYTRHLARMFRKKYKIKLDIEETENIALYVFCRCQKHFTPGETLFITYFCRSLCREIYGHYFNKKKLRKKNKFRVATINDEKINQAKHSTLKRTQEQSSVYVNLKSLPVLRRKIITEHFFNERTFQSIADELGVTKQRVQQITKKCLDILKDQFSE